MRIGLMIYGRLDTLTGGWIYDRLLVDYLQEQGHTIEIISLKQHHYIRNLADNFSRRLYRRLRNHDYELLLQDGLMHPSVMDLNRRLKHRRNCLLVSIVHQVLCRQPLKHYQQLFYQTVERRYFKSVDGFIFNSQTTRANVETLIDRQCSAVVAYPGGDRLGWLEADAAVDSRARRAGPLQLIFVGNLTPNKGVLPLIAGLSRLPQKSWRLAIIGSLTMHPAYVKKVRALIARRGLEDRIDIPGPLDGEDLAGRLSASHVFVLPFSCEGFGIACLEAMAWGLPVIGSTHGALSEFVCDGINGALIPPGDTAAFARQIQLLHNDRGQLARYGQAALKTFHSRPAWRDSFNIAHSFLTSIAK
jgi:glycosyltransferase involved in cell wall biosynthesis